MRDQAVVLPPSNLFMTSQNNYTFFGAFRLQMRSIGAVMMREFIARWGRGSLGFAWLYGETLIFSFPVLFVWHLVRASREGSLPMLPFLWTGYMPILMFRHVGAINIRPISNNRGLLYHRRITPLDIFLGRTLLEMFGVITTVPFTWWIWYIFGYMDPPVHYQLFLVGWLYMSWWVFAFALITAGLSERSELVAHIWSPFSYLYIFWGGFFLIAEWIPYRFRGFVVAIDAPLDCYEMIRGGFFGSAMHPYYNISYLTYELAGLTVLGLWLFKDVRRYITFE